MLIKKFFLIIILASILFSYDLNILIENALKNNYKIKSYNYKILAKQDDIKKAKSAYFPTINIYTSSAFEKYKEVYPNGYNFNIKDHSKYYGINIKQIIFNKSINPNIIDSSLKEKITKLEKKSFILNLYQQILIAYFQVIINKENLVYKKLKKDNFLKILNQMKTEYKYNYVTKTDVVQAKSNYISAVNEYIKLKLLYNKSLENLKILLLSKETLNITGKIRDNISNLIKNSIFYKDKEKIKNNPTLKEYKLYIKIAKNIISQNKAANYPTVYVESNFYNDIHSNTTSDENHFKISLNFNWNIYNGGKDKDSIQAAKELYLASINDFNYQKVMLELSFNENWTNLQNSLELLKSDKEKINKNKEYLLRAQESLKYKMISLTDFYIAQNNYYQSIIDFNNDKLQTIIYYIKLLTEINEIKEKINILNSFIIN